MNIIGRYFLIGLAALTSFLNFGRLPSTSVAVNSGSPGVLRNVSRNWAGYVATNGIYTGVSGTWNIPQVSSNSYGSDATWVGIGGVTTHDLIQVGTQALVGRNGSVQYNAWYEMLPDVMIPVSLSVSAGDSITGSISQQSSGQWLISIKNNTSGQSIRLTQSYGSSLNSAEWIEEAPSGFRRVLPLDNFGSVMFTTASAVRNGQSVTPSQAGAEAVTMAGSGGQLASATGLGGNGSSFSVSRSSGSTAPAGSVSPDVVYRIPPDQSGTRYPVRIFVRRRFFRF